MKTSETVRAYHFVGKTLRDGRPIPRTGRWLVHDGPVKMCESGLYASRHPFDALQYAPGPHLCLVEVDDIVEEGSDKLLCRRRKILQRVDLTDALWAARADADRYHGPVAPEGGLADGSRDV